MSLLCALTFHFLQDKFGEADKLVGKLLDSALVVAGTLLGFLLTITTIMNTIHTRRMAFIKETGNYPVLHNYLKIAIILNIVTISLVIVTPFVSALKPTGIALNITYSTQLFIILWNWFANIRFTIVFIKLLSE